MFTPVAKSYTISASGKVLDAASKEVRFPGAIYDPPCHLQPVLRRLFGFTEGMYPKAEAALARQVCPPMHSMLSAADVEAVADAMIAIAALPASRNPG